MTLPNIDLRGRITPGARYQGARPTCVPFAVSTAHEALRASDGSSPVRLAPESVWRHAVQRAVADTNGMYVAYAGAALDDHGQPSLESWPYNDTLGAGTEGPPAGAGSPPWSRAVLKELRLNRDWVEAPIETALLSGHVVVLTVPVTDEFDYPDASNVVAYSPGAMIRGVHAVAVVGVAEVQGNGRCLLVQNSWGAGWGVSGYAWLTLEFVSEQAHTAHIVIDAPI